MIEAMMVEAVRAVAVFTFLFIAGYYHTRTKNQHEGRADV